MYVVDSAPGGNDPDNYDFSILVEGTDYVRAKIINHLDKMTDGGKGTPLPGGTSFILKLGKYSNTYLGRGIIAEGTIALNVAMLGKWKKFHEVEKEDDTLYLVICLQTIPTTEYHPFIDSGTLRDYSKGSFIDKPGLIDIWDQDENLQYGVTFGWFQSF